MKGEVPEVSGAETLRGSGGFWRRYLVRFRKFPEKMLGKVPEGSSADTLRGSGGWCRCFVKLQTVPTFFMA